MRWSRGHRLSGPRRRPRRASGVGLLVFATADIELLDLEVAAQVHDEAEAGCNVPESMMWPSSSTSGDGHGLEGVRCDKTVLVARPGVPATALDCRCTATTPSPVSPGAEPLSSVGSVVARTFNRTVPSGPRRGSVGWFLVRTCHAASAGRENHRSGTAQPQGCHDCLGEVRRRLLLFRDESVLPSRRRFDAAPVRKALAVGGLGC